MDGKIIVNDKSYLLLKCIYKSKAIIMSNAINASFSFAGTVSD